MSSIHESLTRTKRPVLHEIIARYGLSDEEAGRLTTQTTGDPIIGYIGNLDLMASMIVDERANNESSSVPSSPGQLCIDAINNKALREAHYAKMVATGQSVTMHAKC